MTKRTATIHHLSNPRLRFNWGFWDGVNDQNENRALRDVADHHDKVYANGYQFGYLMAEREYETTTSKYAWRMWLVEVEKRSPAEAGEMAAAAENL